MILRLQAVLADNLRHDLKDEKNNSSEIAQLYTSFQALIRVKKFESNDFMYKDDALAVIDLAEACEMFEELKNNKAAGICFNNIGNIQFKNGRFDKAAENFY